MNYSATYDLMYETPFKRWLETLPKQVDEGLHAAVQGDLPKWQNALQALPAIHPSTIDLNASAIRIGNMDDCDDTLRHQLEETLRELHPWRKGPFNIFGIYIDTEWRSDLKWDRLKGHMAPLKDRLVLDVGCGSGYHCWRMRGQGAKLVIGVDPTVLYIAQYQAMQKYVRDSAVGVFPLGVDDLPANLNHFDTVFSMGLFYHRRSPLDHLQQLKSLLRSGGELVLETLVVDGQEGEVFAPAGRYACMPNVWFIPSVPTLEYWLKRTGFENVRCIDVSQTTSAEQRVTPWMSFHSLENFLDLNNPQKTVEGHPAPQRAIFLANQR